MNTQVRITGYALAAGKRVAYWAVLGLEACRGAHPGHSLGISERTPLISALLRSLRCK